MRKPCDYCDNHFADEEEVIAIIKARYHHIPSRVHFSITVPEEVMEIFHTACYDTALGPVEG